MRVATRRLRSAVRTFAPGLPSRLVPELDEELKWLGGCLGGVRDLDVQLSNLARFAGSATRYRTALAPLREHLESERAARRAELLAAVDSTRYWRLLLRLERFAWSASPRRLPGPRRESIARAGGRAVKKAFRRLLERGRQIPEAPGADDLHVLRLRAKRVRYLLEFLRDVSGKPGRRLVKQLVRLQDLLGAHHDAVVAAERVRQYVEGAGKQSGAATRRALGALVGSEQRTAEQRCAEFQDTWRRFARKRTSRDLETLLRELRDADVSPSEVGA